MTALAAARKDGETRDGLVYEHGVKANNQIWLGGIVEANGKHAQTTVKGAGKKILGIAVANAKGGSADGDVKVAVRRRVAARFKTVSGSVPELGDKAYVEDDQTVHDTASGRTELGVVTAVPSDTEVIVYIE